jgi:hypothetical protein
MTKRAAKLSILTFALLINLNVTLASDYQQIAGLIDLKTTFSDGDLDPESLVELARNKGFGAVVVNDHDRMVMEYGPPPFRNILKKRVELNSINKRGAEEYLNSLQAIEERFPDMIVIPGSQTAPFYYWSGSYFRKDLTAHNHERRILTIGLKRPKDYQGLPIIHNGFSTRFTTNFLPGILISLSALIFGILLLRRKGLFRICGVTIGVLSILSILDTNPFRSSPFDQYHGDQGIAPYQLLLDYVNARGGLTFWNYPETRSGIRKMGRIFVDTPPYPEVLEESRDYTGFAALYGDTITVTEPGNIWDRVLLAYCSGERDRPVWGISTADFHKEGEAGEVLGNFPTVFLVHRKTKREILKALKNGKMYACRGDYPHIVKLDEFSVCSSKGDLIGISGDEVVLEGNPRIKVSLSVPEPTKNPVTGRLIRSGEVIERFEGQLPIKIDFEDAYCKPGERIYYRMDLHGYGKLVSNPIFVISKSR